MRIDTIFVFCRWWDTYIKPQSCFSSPQVYYASYTAKTRTKSHCACVWTRLQMVGHIYRTTSLPRRSTCILRFIYGKNKDKNAIAHAYGRVCRWWDTYIEPQACQDGPHVYCASSTAKTRTKTPLRMRMDGSADGGHIYRTTSLPRRSTCILRFI